jgi:hypothetical protein
VLWQRAVSASTSWLGQGEGGVIAASRDKLVSLDGKGKLLWEYDAPTWGGRRLPLTTFRQAASRLFFLQGGRLFALDADTGRVLWTRWGPSAFTSPAAAARPLSTGYRVSEDTVEVPELRWCLDSRTGEALPDPQQGLPHVVCHREPATGKVLWKYEIPGPTTLTGEAPQLLAFPAGIRRSCLLIVAHNYGTTLQRLDEGKPRWSRPVLFRPDPVWPGGISSDEDTLCFVHDGILTAVGLADGRQRWTSPMLMPKTTVPIRWRALRAGEYVLAYPNEMRQLSFAVPLTFGALECGLTLHPVAGGWFPLFLCDRKTGKLVQRLNLQSPLPRVWVGRRPDVVESRPAVAITPRGLVIHFGDQAWGLSVLP